MHKKEFGKIELIINRLDNLVSLLQGKNYDFTKFFGSDNMIDEFILKLDSFEIEKKKQDKMREIVIGLCKDNLDIKNYIEKKSNNINDYLENSIRVEDFGNYYILWVHGLPSFDVNFIFDKDGNLLLGNKYILGIDKDNFFVFDYDISRISEKLYHYQVKDFGISLVNVLDDIVDVDYCDFFDKDLVVCCTSEDKILYNYNDAKVVIPSFSFLSNDVGNFELDKDEIGSWIRVVKKLYGVDNYKSVLVSKLEFLVSKTGNVVSFVSDFEKDYSYFLMPYYGDSQEERLNSIYNEVVERYNCKKRLKKQN